MKRKNIYSISAIAVALILFFSFMGFTYYADAAAVSKTQVELENIDLIKIYSNGLTLGFIVKFVNPSDREINDLSSEFGIYIDTINIGSGSFSNIDIKSNGETSRPITITVSYLGLASSAILVIKNFVNGQKIGFSIQGTVTADVLFGLTDASQKFVAAS